MKRFFSLAVSAILAVSVLTGCDSDKNNDSADTTVVVDAVDSVESVGQGQTTFRFEVKASNGEVALFDVHTDKTTVGDALLDAGLIEGDAGQYGLYVSSVGGVAADYDADKAYWAFYIDGEYANSGVDSTDIDPTKTYSFVYETA
ncbi:MAG: DUF4430 domain-containing protein [Oscillospiraceae bacterium]|jgi:hypothetical protein|nr:DUF4430 domain-containing protein [Oscillospiraceae bacterium]